MSPTAIPAKVEPAAKVRCDCNEARLPEGPNPRLLAIMAKGPKACHGHAAVEALRAGAGASCVTFYRGQGHGWRVECEAAAPGFAAMAPPEEIMGRHGAMVSGAVSQQGVTWVAAGSAEGLLVAAFEGAREDARTAFEASGAPVAEFLARCYSSDEAPDGADALLGAISSIIHDSLDIVTGFAMCAGVYSQQRQSGLPATPQEEAILQRTAAALEALCREYARLDRAVSMRLLRQRAAGLIASYAELLRTLGIEVETTSVDKGFSLSAHARGVALRALVHLALAMLEAGAREAKVRARTTVASRIAVSFVCGAHSARHLARAVAGAVELVDAKGGKAEVRRRGRCAMVSLTFANAPSVRS